MFMLDLVRPRRRTEIRADPLPDGSAVLFDSRSEMAYAITTTATQVWEACDGVHTTAAIVEELAAMYDAPSEVINRDVQALLQHFAACDLLELETGAGE
jgi:hypothetical protein